jgi:hypothetical protein
MVLISVSGARSPLPEPVIAARAISAMLGSLTADAASMPLHWIYNTSRIAELVGTGNPEFFNPPSCPFYSYQPGWNTPYGQQYMAYMSVGADTGAFCHGSNHCTAEGLTVCCYCR